MRNYSCHVVFPGYGNTKEKMAAFDGIITNIDIWSHDDQKATLVHFDSNMMDLYVHLHNALIRGFILDYGIRIAKSEEVIRKEKEERYRDTKTASWRKKLTDDLDKTIYNCEQDPITAIEYDGDHFTFRLRQEAWKEFHGLSDTRVDEVLRELGVDPEKGWR